jgi:hypothetical protein
MKWRFPLARVRSHSARRCGVQIFAVSFISTPITLNRLQLIFRPKRSIPRINGFVRMDWLTTRADARPINNGANTSQIVADSIRLGARIALPSAVWHYLFQQGDSIHIGS